MAAALSCLLLLCSAVLSGCALGGSSAACARELPTVEPSRAAPGETFRLSGEGFGRACRDTSPSLQFERPQRDVRIEMRQGGKKWELATVDADRDFAVEAVLEVPKGAGPGRAAVVVPNPEGRDPARPLKVPFRVLGDGTR